MGGFTRRVQTRKRVSPGVLARGIFKGERVEKTLLIGSSQKARALRGWLQRKSEIGLHTIGLLCDEQIAQTEDGVPVLGNSDAIMKGIFGTVGEEAGRKVVGENAARVWGI